MENKTFQINLISEKEGGYTVTVPQLPGCVSYGETIEEAKKNIQEAIALHLANIKEHNKRGFIGIINRTVLSTVIEIKESYA
ncbi:MAG: type II toxin-antitoxin system HicB family antitoxin [Patescibacteria group bacterium]